MKEATKALLISAVFFCLFLCFGTYNYFTLGSVNATSDFLFHWEKIHDVGQYPSYPMGYHIVFAFFLENELVFYVANLALICVLMPILLFVGTKTWWSTALYFMGISLPHLLIYGATYPQAFVFLFLIIYLLNRKNPLIFILCALIATFSHQKGAYIFALVFLAEAIDFLVTKYISKKKLAEWPNAFSPIVTVLGIQKFSSIFAVMFFLITQISIPVWVLAKPILKKPFWLVMAVIPLVYLFQDPRIIGITQLALIFVVAPEISKSKHKKIIVFFLMIQLAFFLLDFGSATQTLLKTKSF